MIQKLQEIINAFKNNWSLNKIAGAGGFKYISFAAGPAYTGLELTNIAIRESTVITVLTLRSPSGTSDYLTASGISTITLNSPDLLTAPNGCVFTAVTFTSGSALGYM